VSGQQAFRGERDSLGKVAAGHAPDVEWNAAAGVQKHVEFHACVEWGQSFVHNSQGGRLRGQQTAETNQDRCESTDLDEIHPGSFDFTLGTA
jgi:hypothetical protein